MTHSTMGPLSSVTREPPASQIQNLQPQNHRQKSVGMAELHRTAGTVKQQAVWQFWVTVKTSQTLPRKTFGMLVREFLSLYGHLSYPTKKSHTSADDDSHVLEEMFLFSKANILLLQSHGVNSITVFYPFRQSKYIKYIPDLQVMRSSWEAGLSPGFRPYHSGPRHGRPGSGQQPGDCSDQFTVPTELWSLRPPSLPGSWPFLAGSYCFDCHSNASGQILCVQTMSPCLSQICFVETCADCGCCFV